MNSAYIVLFGIVWFIFAYYWYGGIIKKKLIVSNDENVTPSNSLNDGKDYVPTKTPILFGHHFSSIAGAGPIIGPIFAFAWFGWLPALIWILVGSVFMGAVHDYTSMMVSVRNEGKSIVEIAEKYVSKRARTIFAVFVWLTLTLVQAVFAKHTANTLTNSPEIVIPTFGIILIAVIFGTFVIRRNLNTVIGTILALAAMYGFIELGKIYPIVGTYDLWLPIFIVYSLIAAILPVWTLLQPRDYLSMYILVIGLALGFAGVLVLQPTINAPAMVEFNSAKGPLFPVLFITVACGAISGFHSLVSSGTSSKQLIKEGHAKIVGYGGMLTEGLLALLVIVMIAGVLVWDPATPGADPSIVFSEILKSGNPIGVFGKAFGLTVASLGIPETMGFAFGILMLNAFILTSLDTSARLNRYIVQETLGAKYGGIFKNKYFAAGSSLLLAYILCVTESNNVIWPLFGASNQLIATLALFVVTAYFLAYKTSKWYTLIPAVIMLVITEAALIYQFAWQYIPDGKWLLAFMSIVLFVLGLAVAFEVVMKMWKKTPA